MGFPDEGLGRGEGTRNGTYPLCGWGDTQKVKEKRVHGERSLPSLYLSVTQNFLELHPHSQYQEACIKEAKPKSFSQSSAKGEALSPLSL